MRTQLLADSSLTNSQCQSTLRGFNTHAHSTLNSQHPGSYGFSRGRYFLISVTEYFPNDIFQDATFWVDHCKWKSCKFYAESLNWRYGQGLQEATSSAHGDADPKSTQVSYRCFCMTFVTHLIHPGFQKTALTYPFQMTHVINSASQETALTFPPSPTQPPCHMSTQSMLSTSLSPIGCSGDYHPSSYDTTASTDTHKTHSPEPGATLQWGLKRSRLLAGTRNDWG